MPPLVSLNGMDCPDWLRARLRPNADNKFDLKLLEIEAKRIALMPTGDRKVEELKVVMAMTDRLKHHYNRRRVLKRANR